MTISNERAAEVMRELGQDNYRHLSELKEACEEQLKIVIRTKKYSFFTDWDEDDYCSEVMNRVWEDRKNYDSTRGAFPTWLGVLERTVYCKHCEKMKTEVQTAPMIETDKDGNEINVLENQPAADSTEGQVIAKETCRQVLEELKSLPENQKKAIELCKIKGYKPAEAAEIMGCSAPDISRWLHRGLEKIKHFAERENLSAIAVSDRPA